MSGPSNSPAGADEPQQKAMTRIQAEAKINFESDQRATLRLKKCRLGQLNELVESPQQVQPMGKFNQVPQIDSDKKEMLALPVQFSYNDGVVENVQVGQFNVVGKFYVCKNYFLSFISYTKFAFG